MIQHVAPLFPIAAANGLSPVRIWVFPGQGSQTVGMGKDFLEESGLGFSPVYRDHFDRAHRALLSEVGLDLRTLVLNGPADQLTRTLHAQPALLASNVSFFEHLAEVEGIAPAPGDLMAGHSLGEWSAYVAARAITIEQGALAVYWRGRYMEEAFPFDPNAGSPMAAIMDLPEEIVTEVCRQTTREGHAVVAANLNTPAQIVISGNPAAIAEASAELKSRGASKVVPLKVAAPFHSPLMEPVKEKLARKLEELGISFAPTQNTVIANFTAQPMAPDANHLESLLNQITGSVRWKVSMIRAWELGAAQMVNVDVSGNVLLGMADKIFSRRVPVQSVDPTIPMHRHALRAPAGTIRTTVFAPEPEVATRRILEFSYDAGSVANQVKRLLAAGDVETALIVLDNRYNVAREAGMRVLKDHDQAQAHGPRVIEAMKARGFVNEEDGSLAWPEPVVRDLPTHPLPPEIEAQIRGEIFSGLAALKLAPLDPETLSYYAASRWGGEEKRLEEILKRLRRILGLNALKLSLTIFKDESGEEQKGIDSWEKVVLYIDTNKEISFPHPGAMTQGDCA